MSDIVEYWDVQWTDGAWYNLHAYAYHVESIYGARTNVPALRGSNVAVYGRRGQLHQPKMADQRIITLQGWVSDRNPSDVPYTEDCNPLQGVNRNWRMIRRLLWRENGDQFNLRRRWWDENGNLIMATAQAEYAGGLDLSEHVSEAGAWTCDLNLADPYFYGDVQTVVLAKDVAQVVTNLGDVPAVKIIITFENQLQNPVITNSTPNPDVWVQMGSAIGAGDAITLDVDAFTAVRTSDGANMIGGVTRSGARPWMVLSPSSNTLTLTATSGTGTADFTWQPAYL